MNSNELLRAGLRSTDDLLSFDENSNLVVVGIDDNGNKVNLGHITRNLMHQDPEAARMAISIIQVGKRPNKSQRN